MLKKTKFVVCIALTTIIFNSCTEETPVGPVSSLFVIEAFLYEGEPVTSIHITGMLPIGSSDTIAPGIDNADVRLIKNNTAFSLVKTTNKPGYYHYEGSELQVNISDNFRLEVNYDGRLAYGETIVPEKPQGVNLSANTIAVPEIPDGGVDDYSILLSWDNPDDSYYNVVIENFELNPTPIFGNDSVTVMIRRVITPPSKTSELIINPQNISYLGNHRATVYKVNQEYADLYETREQDSRNLQEPLTNIENGLGVFTAFASDTVSFVVTR